MTKDSKTPTVHNMKKAIVLFLATTLFLFVSCKKNQLGGKSTVHGVVAHHDKPIPHARVFIKFNATEFPGADTAAYDAHVVAGHHGEYSFDCYKGDYYLYGYGFDTGINETVSGGLPVKVRHKEDREMKVAVTE